MLPWLPTNISGAGRELDVLMCALLATVVVGMAVSLLALIWVMRRRSWRSLRVILLPVILMVLISLAINARALAVQRKTSALPAREDELVRIEARQFAWNFRHAGPDQQFDTADDVVTNGQLHVTVGKTVQFELMTRDVLHSLWVPSLRLKIDAEPAKTAKGSFSAERVGEYSIRCGAACGVGKDAMQATLIVETPADHEKFLKKQDVP